MNSNFTNVRDTFNTYAVLTDTAKTVTVTHTFSAKQAFSAGIDVTGTLAMLTAVSKLVPGATSFSLRNNADTADNLILTDAGAATFRSTVDGITTLTATTLAGTLSTAVQPNITTLTGLTGATITGKLTFSGTNTHIVPGTSAVVIRNVGDTLNAIQVGAADVSIGVHTTVTTQIGTVLATGANAGHLLLPNCPGTPTGTPIGASAIVWDSSGHKLFAWTGSAWKSVAFA